MSKLFNRKPKTENRKPKTENRKPKTENRKPKTETRNALAVILKAGPANRVSVLGHEVEGS